MSDRIAVMSNGRIEQIGPPAEIYEEPATAYVADFLGVSNLMNADAEGASGDRCRVRLGDRTIEAGQGDLDARGPVKVCIRPERVDVEPQGTAGDNRLPGIVERKVYVGSVIHGLVTLASGEKLQAWVTNDGSHSFPYEAGQAVSVHFPAEALRVLQDTTPEAELQADLQARSA